MTEHRVLLIGARGDVDFIRAGQLVRQFAADRAKHSLKPGRHHCVIYATPGQGNAAAVWYSDTQVTVHFGERA